MNSASMPPITRARHTVETKMLSLPFITCGAELEYPAYAAPPGDWLAHVPFAFWMVEQLRPRTIAEAGLASGNSYCAFLQAVRALRLDAECVGIRLETNEPAEDRGDDLRDFKAHHDPRYGSFSKLVRCRFDGAAARLPQRGVDLLHLGGGMTDTMPVDLPDWLPHMSSRGIILVHGIAANAGRRTIKSFWDALASRYPCFAFVHADGLGAAYVGTEPLSGPLADLFGIRQAETRSAVQAYFSRLGISILDRFALQQAQARLAEPGTNASSAQAGREPAAAEEIRHIAAQRDLAVRILRQQAVAAIRRERERTQLPGRNMFWRALRITPRGLKDLVPLSVKRYVVWRFQRDE